MLQTECPYCGEAFMFSMLADHDYVRLMHFKKHCTQVPWWRKKTGFHKRSPQWV